jgi:hypothetical protein
VIGKVAPDPALRVLGDEPATAANSRIRRASGNAAGPDGALHVVGDESATATTATRRKATKRASTEAVPHVGSVSASGTSALRAIGSEPAPCADRSDAAEAALRVVGSDASSTAAEPGIPGGQVGNGQ